MRFKKLGVIATLLMSITIGGCSSGMNAIYEDDNKIQSYTSTFNLNAKHEILNKNSYSGDLKFEGVNTIWKYEALEAGKVDIDILCELKSGRFKLVLVDGNGNSKILVELDEVGKEFNENIEINVKKDEVYRIRAVGDEANINLEITSLEGVFNILGI
ncbi:MAG: hypothetical protein ACRDDL_04635 [Sarcina sp.]